MTVTKLIAPPILATLILTLPACVAVPAVPSVDCPIEKAHVLTYGVKNKKTIFQIKEKVSVKQGNGLVFQLDPENSRGTPIDFEAAEVTIVGKPDDPNNVWITEKSGNFAANGKYLGVCVPTNQATDIEYQYMVHVEHLGTLDPRVIVEPQ